MTVSVWTSSALWSRLAAVQMLVLFTVTTFVSLKMRESDTYSSLYTNFRYFLRCCVFSKMQKTASLLYRTTAAYTTSDITLLFFDDVHQTPSTYFTSAFFFFFFGFPPHIDSTNPECHIISISWVCCDTSLVPNLRQKKKVAALPLHQRSNLLIISFSAWICPNWINPVSRCSIHLTPPSFQGHVFFFFFFFSPSTFLSTTL